MVLMGPALRPWLPAQQQLSSYTHALLPLVQQACRNWWFCWQLQPLGTRLVAKVGQHGGYRLAQRTCSLKLLLTPLPKGRELQEPQSRLRQVAKFQEHMASKVTERGSAGA
jgi:hypothetical protein